ncbi:50S ribosomal protein L10 [Sideroxydans sp. CL21]|uniref:50S ribosomal protein L10 n=1 Tax=Sideroxydans sp. CL21 TaxID=2600596 RepID=UPI0024BC85AA|nr:50S ribosomal protein L10 [Sideroxydans sp. CL21]
MGLNLQEKQAVVAEVSAQVAQAQTIVLAEYRGIEVGDITKLRANARKSGVYFRVVKNTLARRAVQGTPFEVLAEKMEGPLVYGISADPVAAAKVVYDFARTNEKLVITAGAYNGKMLDKAGVSALATVPPKEVLLAQLLGLLQSPVSGLARVLVAVAEKKTATA